MFPTSLKGKSNQCFPGTTQTLCCIHWGWSLPIYFQEKTPSEKNFLLLFGLPVILNFLVGTKNDLLLVCCCSVGALRTGSSCDVFLLLPKSLLTVTVFLQLTCKLLPNILRQFSWEFQKISGLALVYCCWLGNLLCLHFLRKMVTQLDNLSGKE